MFNLSPMKTDGQKLLDVFASDLSTIRTGRARPSLVENLEVEAYGGKMKLLELASISAPDTSSIVIKPWDKSVIKDIEKAITISDLHIQPVVDGEQIRLSIPALTGERRQELIKLVGQKKNAALEMLRDIRIKYKKQIDNQKGQPGISEDAIKKDLEDMQKVTEEYTTKIEDMEKTKEKELSEL
ncbi:MAG: ribosome recycling factor [Candidatus Woesebacteria bacterium]